jgi:hypothetical protein
MKICIVAVSLLFASIALGSSLFAQSQYGKIKVIDDENKPLSNAFVVHNNFVVGITDQLGCCDINISKSDTLKISYVGFEILVIIASQIPENETVSYTMKRISARIETVDVLYLNPNKIIKKAREDFNGILSGENKIAYGCYQKTAYQNNKCVGFEYHEGFMVSTNEKQRREKIHLRSFIPEHSCVSDFFVNEYGSKKPLIEKFSANYSFNANSTIWDKALVAHEKYGPQNQSTAKYYNIEMIERNDTSLVYIFCVNKKKYPGKIPVDARGYIYIDVRLGEIMRIHYEHFNFIHHVMFNAKKTLVPAYQCVFEVEYTEGNKSVPKSVILTRKWLDKISDASKYVFWPKPVRLKPTETKLQECEKLLIKSFVDLNSNYTEGHEFSMLAPLMATNYYIRYDKHYWDENNIISGNNFKSDFSDLSSGESIREQFERNNNQWIMGKNYNDYYILEQFHHLFYKSWERIDTMINTIKTHEGFNLN